MRLSHDRLKVKALLALEEAERAAGKAPAERTYWLRFCLAYLFAVSNGDREPFDGFWRAVTDARTINSEHQANVCRKAMASAKLEAIYRAVGIRRSREMMFAELYRRRRDESG